MWVSSDNSQETAGDTDLGDMPATPSICIKGPSLFMSAEFTVCMDGIAFTTTCNRAVASKLMFLLYFVLNVEYPAEVALTMKFVQRAIAGINPDKNSKARKTSRKQQSLTKCGGFGKCLRELCVLKFDTFSSMPNALKM
ncbi:unnamed protein product [Ixodes persulcatus]